MRCDQCKFWTPPTKPYGNALDIPDFGVCSRTPDVSRAGDFSYDYRLIVMPGYEDRTAIAQAEKGYCAGLRTKAEHFCAMFQGNSA